MKYVSPLLVVSDMERATDFYERVLGLSVESNLGENVTLHGGISLQTQRSWLRMAELEDCALSAANTAELYFEEPEFDAFAAKVATMEDVQLLHAAKEERWRQRTIRFYDPDGHIVEVGEPLESVALRLVDGGMTDMEAADAMDVMPSFVRSVLKKRQAKD